MRVVIDACVLYPTVLREVVTGCAAAGLFEARWSPRIIAEWVRATAKLGPEAPLIAQGEAVALALRFPRASVAPPDDLTARLWLPDPADTHVLACAITAHADAILTLNAADFPRDVLADHGLQRLDPDTFLLSLHDRAPQVVAQVAGAVAAEASRLSGQTWTPRAILKRARLNRLARRFAA
jgi:predicted nucleic acid-binding protein